MSRLDAKYAKARDALAKAEQRLVRAQNAWQKARETERRLGARLDRAPLDQGRGPKIPGEFDMDDLAEAGMLVDQGEEGEQLGA